MSSIVLKIPTESQSFRAALTDATLRDRVQEWMAAAVALDDAIYIPLRTDWMPNGTRRTTDGVEVLLAGRWPPEVVAEQGPRISGAVFGRVWEIVCGASGSPDFSGIATCGLYEENNEQSANRAQSEAPAVAQKSVSDGHVLPPVQVGPGQTPDRLVEAIDPKREVDPGIPTDGERYVPDAEIDDVAVGVEPEPVIADVEIDAATPWSPDGGVDTLTPIVKLLEHYGARFLPGFFDRPIEEVRADLKQMARDEKVIHTYAAEREQQAAAAEKRQRENEEYEAATLRAQYTRTDAGNADRFVATFGADVRYCDAFKGWFVWNGGYWARDETKQILALATEVARGIYHEAQVCSDADFRQALGKWAIATESLNRRKAMIESVAPYVALRPDALDAHPMLLNCRNGTLDLETITFREPCREDLLTKQAGVEYAPGAVCPLWLAHLDLVFAGDREVINGFQQMAGYSLIDGNPEQVMFILFGRGKNGKSVTMRVLSEVLGDYAVNIAPESLMIKGNDVIRSDLARLKGARMATSSEGNEGALLAENVVKSLTGNEDKLTVARKYENEFEFIPTAKIWLATNHEPRIKGTDDGIWRRIWLIPFEVQIPEGQRDPQITDKLLAERTGILNWMLDGLRKYQEQGMRLRPPAKVVAATKQYRKESDVLGRAIDEELVCGAAAKGRIIARKELTAGLRRWFEEQDERMPGPQKIAQALRERGVADGPVQGGVRYWIHARWKTDEEQEDDGIRR